VHTAPKGENLQLRKKNCGHTQGRIPQLATTERNHPTGPQFTAKVDQFFAAVDTKQIVSLYSISLLPSPRSTQHHRSESQGASDDNGRCGGGVHLESDPQGNFCIVPPTPRGNTEITEELLAHCQSHPKEESPTCRRATVFLEHPISSRDLYDNFLVLPPRYEPGWGSARGKGRRLKVLRNQPRCGCKLRCFYCEIDFAFGSKRFDRVPYSRKQAPIGAGFHPGHSTFVSGCKRASPS
jgi:hypothetical protein